MSTRTAASGAATMRRLRQAHGWSLSDLARAVIDAGIRIGQPLGISVASVQRSVARWESATRPSPPGERYQLLLAHVYARTADGDVSTGSGSDFVELLDALAALGASERRVLELRELTLRAATDTGGGLLALLSPATRDALTLALADPAQADEALVAGMRGTVDEVNAQVGSLPFVRLQLLLTPVLEGCRRLLTGDVPGPLHTELSDVAASAFTLGGRLAFETRDDNASRALYAEATAAAGRLPDLWPRAVVNMSHALVTLYSTRGIEAARALVDEAVRDARSGGSVVVRARAHALQAEIAARAGSQRHAQAALGLAWYDMDSSRDDDPSPSSFSPAHLRGFEGVCELYVGDPATAHETFARSAATLSAPRERVQRAIVRADQALARVKLGEARDAADLLHECIDASSSTGGRVSVLRVRHARRELAPWRREDFVADLDDHLMDYLAS